MASPYRSLMLVGLLYCAGCAVLPLPVVGHTGMYKSIDDEGVAFIEPGVTKKEDVLLRLGAPDSFEKQTYGYMLEKYSGGLLWAWVFGVAYQGTGDIGTTLRITNRSLLIEFDSDHVVNAYRFTDAESRWRTKCLQYCR